MEGLTTSEVAKASGVNVETIRFYENKGLIPKAPRTAAGYRIFTEETIHEIRTIKNAQALGFTLHEIRMLMDLRRNSGSFSADELVPHAQSKLREVQQTIETLENLKALLESALRSNPSPSLPEQDCPVLRKISSENECRKINHR